MKSSKRIRIYLLRPFCRKLDGFIAVAVQGGRYAIFRLILVVLGWVLGDANSFGFPTVLALLQSPRFQRDPRRELQLYAASFASECRSPTLRRAASV